jgi:hypothetical protein
LFWRGIVIFGRSYKISKSSDGLLGSGISAAALW